MNMDVVYVFTENNCRRELWTREQSLANSRAFLNPDLRKVKGLPPHEWKPPVDGMKEHGAFEPMTEAEKAERKAHHEKYGVINDPHFRLPPPGAAEPKKSNARLYLGIAAGLALAAYLIAHFVK